MFIKFPVTITYYTDGIAIHSTETSPSPNPAIPPPVPVTGPSNRLTAHVENVATLYNEGERGKHYLSAYYLSIGPVAPYASKLEPPVRARLFPNGGYSAWRDYVSNSPPGVNHPVDMPEFSRLIGMAVAANRLPE
jgi:hypothetical protein